MIRIRQMRLVSYIAVMLLVVMYVVPTACVAKEARKPVPPPTKTVVIFPFHDEAQSPLDTLGKDLPDSIQTSLSATGSYRAFAFSERLPSVQRAVIETTLKKDDLQGPFGTDPAQLAAALKISHELASDQILVGSIDSVKVDSANKKAEVALTAILADGKTGESLKTIAVTGEAPATVQPMSDKDLVALAAGDAVAKLTREIAPVVQQPVEEPVVSRKRSSGGRKLVFSLLLGLAVGLIATSGNGSSDSGTPDNPPPVPF